MQKRKRRKKRKIGKLLLIIILIIIGIMTYRTIQSDRIAGESFLSGIFSQEKEIREADTSGDWKLILVNREYSIPKDYPIELKQLSNGTKVDKRIYPELQKMFDDARASGLSLFVRAGYRTQEEQQAIMDEKIQAYEAEGYSKRIATKRAKKYVAIPGTSEHQLGLSVDINAEKENTPSEQVYEWLKENSYKYGFVKRYPSDKTDITGISNEPWHYRYVGKKAAKVMKEENLCLEEYLEKYDQK